MIYNSLKKNRNIKFLIIFSVVFLVFFSFGVSNTEASATTTLRGKAWWQDNGFVYFNCKDDEMGDKLNEIGNLKGAGKYLPPDDKFHFFAPPCANSNHKVTIDSEGNFRGQAWNQRRGFISFEGTDDPPNGYGTLSPDCNNKCNASNDCWACYVESEKKVYGWARVDNTGEWIRLDNATDNPVYLETCANGALDAKIYKSPGVQEISLLPGDFYGYGTSTSSVNTLLFNCKNDPRNTGDTCFDAYKIYLETLTIGSMTAPHFSYSEACSSNSLGATLRWCVKSGQQKSYEIVINETDFGTSLTQGQIDSAFCKTGIINSNINSFSVAGNCALEYGKNYFWWLRLYDELDAPTQWYQYYGNTSGDTDRNPDNNNKTFSTFKHRFPNPFFTWSPLEVKVGSTTQFSATSSVFYATGNPNPQACSGPNCFYSWRVSGLAADISATNSIETDITFMDQGEATVFLEVSDIDNYKCERGTLITEINYELPIWREIKAK